MIHKNNAAPMIPAMKYIHETIDDAVEDEADTGEFNINPAAGEGKDCLG